MSQIEINHWKALQTNPVNSFER